MFDTLLSLPLFQGLGHADLTRILESTRLEFETAHSGTIIVRQDQPCTGLTFILKGDVTVSTSSADRTWSVEEKLATPAVIGLEVLYGTLRSHRQTLTTCSETHLLQMEKRTVGALTAYFEVFRLNVMNLLTTSIVRHDLLHWLPAEKNLKGRIRHFMRTHVQRPVRNLSGRRQTLCLTCPARDAKGRAPAAGTQEYQRALVRNATQRTTISGIPN